jgi:type I restriction enzyme S subunit
MAKAEWKPRRLDELGFVGRGKSRHRPRNEARLYGGPYPFIQTADVMAADPYITSYSQTYSGFGFQQSKIWPPKPSAPMKNQQSFVGHATCCCRGCCLGMSP